MNLLQISKIINAELSQIESRHKDVLNQQEALSIFDGIVTCITNELVNTFQFAIVNRQEPSEIFFRWAYDLTDQDHIERSGPDLQHILASLKQIRRGTAHLICEVRWSSRFLSMDQQIREQVLHGTYWDRQGDTPMSPMRTPALDRGKIENSTPQIHTSPRPMDLELLELDLLKMETEAHYIRKEERAVIYKSACTWLREGYCHGILFEVFDDEHRQILAWGFELDTTSRLIRTGNDQEQVLGILSKLSNLPLKTTPLFTQKFEELSQKKQQEVMKDTVWAPKKKGLFG